MYHQTMHLGTETTQKSSNTCCFDAAHGCVGLDLFLLNLVYRAGACGAIDPQNYSNYSNVLWFLSLSGCFVLVLLLLLSSKPMHTESYSILASMHAFRYVLIAIPLHLNARTIHDECVVFIVRLNHTEMRCNLHKIEFSIFAITDGSSLFH